MARIWESNEERDENEELVVTEQRDSDAPAVTADSEESIEATSDDPREVIEQFSEDVESSPARRGHESDVS